MSYGAAPPFAIDAKEQAIRDGRAFVFSTGLISVGAGSFLNVRFENTGTKRVVVFKRRFDNNVLGGASPLQYGGIAAPAPIVAPSITSTGSNLVTGGSTATSLTMTAKMDSTRINNAAGNAVPTGAGFLPTNGEPLKLVEWRILAPGQVFANYIVGAAAGLGSITCGFTLYAWEEPNT